MKIRHFVTYFWFILMFIGSSFGIFYLITGQNIITGQTRHVKDVLPAKDERKNNLGEKVKTNDPKTTPKPTVVATKKEEIDPELLKFNEVMAKTSNKNAFKLTPKTPGNDAAVFFRFGAVSDEGNIAVYASGLDEKKKYFAWLATSTKSIKLGEVKKLDDTNVIKLGLILKDDTYSNYTKAVLTTESDDKNEDLKTENVLFTTDLKFTDGAVSSTPSVTVTPKSTPNQ